MVKYYKILRRKGEKLYSAFAYHWGIEYSIYQKVYPRIGYLYILDNKEIASKIVNTTKDNSLELWSCEVGGAEECMSCPAPFTASEWCNYWENGEDLVKVPTIKGTYICKWLRLLEKVDTKSYGEIDLRDIDYYFNT